MSRLAVVTGGTRGIGEAISVVLKANGFTVAATYAGNDEAAAAFSKANDIKVYKFDVGDYDACEKAVAQITEEMGPIEVLVNNAGITRDSTMHRMSQSGIVLQHEPAGYRKHARTRVWPDRQYWLH
jgi:acetoacetyl-CoA reductase